ncbi:hypothetical protein HYS82_01695 [Candidatus Amesbacteria bacterium]|nr:hypothetical protein [Candidatus Amesbacteria bacterium]MBI2587363.1 hypothetical protein [Candidatus Amesbacteria bacterium]
MAKLDQISLTCAKERCFFVNSAVVGHMREKGGLGFDEEEIMVDGEFCKRRCRKGCVIDSARNSNDPQLAALGILVQQVEY